MLCVYEFKQLVGENEIDYRLSPQKRLNILSFKTFDMNEIHQQNHVCFNGKKHTAHKMPLNIYFRNCVNRIFNTYLLFIIKSCFKKLI